MSETLFPGFTRRRITVAGNEINLMLGGSGPPVLLIHGYPQTHACWHAMAPELAKRHEVDANAGDSRVDGVLAKLKGLTRLWTN